MTKKLKFTSIQDDYFTITPKTFYYRGGLGDDCARRLIRREHMGHDTNTDQRPKGIAATAASTEPTNHIATEETGSFSADLSVFRQVISADLSGSIQVKDIVLSAASAIVENLGSSPTTRTREVLGWANEGGYTVSSTLPERLNDVKNFIQESRVNLSVYSSITRAEGVELNALALAEGKMEAAFQRAEKCLDQGTEDGFETALDELRPLFGHIDIDSIKAQ